MREIPRLSNVQVANRNHKAFSNTRVTRVKKRHPNHRLVKIHRTYNVQEVAELFKVHKNTVRRWMKEGLPTVDDKRPTLILGRELIAFVHVRRLNKKQRCQPGQMFCFKCRLPKFPGAGMVDCQPVSKTVGNLTAICPDCSSCMHRVVNMSKVSEFCEEIGIAFPQARLHIREISQPTLNSDLRGDI